MPTAGKALPPHVVVQQWTPTSETDNDALPEWLLPCPSVGRYRTTTPFAEAGDVFVIRVHEARAKLAPEDVVRDVMAAAQGERGRAFIFACHVPMNP
jgi:hypothetical protein